MPESAGLSNPILAFDPRLLEQLACPVCHGTLRLADAGAQIGCSGCERKYPLVDGIPVLIAERAVPAGQIPK